MTIEEQIEDRKTLTNGAEILRRTKVVTPAGSVRWIMLCSWKDDQEYVTWLVDNRGNAALGHYFPLLAYEGTEDPRQAARLDTIEDYKQRCKSGI